MVCCSRVPTTAVITLQLTILCFTLYHIRASVPIPDFRGSRRASILMLTRRSNIAKTGVSSAAELGHECFSVTRILESKANVEISAGLPHVVAPCSQITGMFFRSRIFTKATSGRLFGPRTARATSELDRSSSEFNYLLRLGPRILPAQHHCRLLLPRCEPLS
jgi:hypothetical protein